ncbi:MAG: acetyl-CoA C-acetyltransferase [Acidimicrobiales bacterium]
MTNTVILDGARTPIGKLSGGLASKPATELGGHAIAAALERSGVSGDQIGYVWMGQVVQAGAGQVPARKAAALGGIPLSVPSSALNKACLSGMEAVYLAHRLIEAGDAEIVVAGGMESMTNAPYLLPKARAGYRYGHGEVVDSLNFDGLFCTLDACLMGESTEKYSASASIERDRQDAFSAESHERAARAIKDGIMAEEITPVSIPQRKGDPLVIDTDEGVREGITVDTLGGLRPAFAESGNITAGNASQISDGAAALVVTSRDKAEELSVEPLAEIVSYGQMAGPDTSLLTKPSQAALQALDRVDLSVSDVDLFEMNEAFAAVALASMDELGIPDDIVNVNGGAIALGHPIGMTGARLVLTLAYELKRRGGGLGSASLCGGGGQGDALLIRV